MVAAVQSRKGSNNMQYTKTVTLDINNTEVEAVLTFNHTPFSPGFYSGQPEDCYPCEPEEYELIKLVAGDNDCSWMIELIRDSLIEQLGDDNEG